MACRQLGLGYANHGLQVRGEKRETKALVTKVCALALETGVYGLTRTPSYTPQETWYWDSGNVTEVVMSGVRCTGSELSLSQCAHHSTHITCKRTGTRFTAGVICSESE